MGVFRASAASSKAERGKERGEVLGRSATRVLSWRTIVFFVGVTVGEEVVFGSASSVGISSSTRSVLIAARGGGRGF